MKVSTEPTHLINFEEHINAFALCNNSFASNLICIASEKKITLGFLRFPEESEDEVFEWQRLKDIHHVSWCHHLCFAPDTSYVAVPKSVTFCAAGGDFVLRIFRTDLQNDDTVQELLGHSSYINDCSWDYEGEYLASAGDDHSCRIWCLESHYVNVTTFCLSSAGVSVKWHPEEPYKVMVAEKKGIMHMYNVRSQQAVLSLEAYKSPLMSADWSLSNRLFVTALVAGDIFTWDLRHPCTPYGIKQVHEDGGRIIRFSNNSEHVYASVGRPDITLKVYTAKSTVALFETSLKLYCGMAWHSRLPYVAAAYDKKLSFWKISLK